MKTIIAEHLRKIRSVGVSFRINMEEADLLNNIMQKTNDKDLPSCIRRLIKEEGERLRLCKN